MRKKRVSVKNRILSILLMFAMVAAYFPASPVMAATANQTASGTYDKFGVKLTADPLTSAPIGGTDGFGTDAADGRIWTGKDVKPNNDSSFDVTLSALAQEYAVAAEDEGNGNPGLGGNSGGADVLAADVTFILDMSSSMGSMSGTDITGTGGPYLGVAAMAKAANAAIRTVMDANPKNRVAVHWFGGAATATHVGTIMNMDSYTLGAGMDYLVYSNEKIKANSSLIAANGSSFNIIDTPLGGGTPTQNGIRYGISKTIASLPGVRGTEPQRKPYVFVLSDGAAIAVQRAWNKEITGPTSPSSYTGQYDVSDTNLRNTGSAEIAALTILTGMFMKGKLDAAYKAYNGPSSEISSKLYTVGLGSDTAINGPYNGEAVYAWAGLDPATVFLKKDTNYQQDSAKKTYAEIIKYANGALINLNDFVYSDYYQFANDYGALSGAFTELSGDVKAATTIPPLLNLFTPGLGFSAVPGIQGEASAIAIVDEIEKGFALDLSTLAIGTAKAVNPTLTADGTVYGFSGYASKVVVKKNDDGSTTLTWYINAEDMKLHIYRFINRENPSAGDGKGNKYEDPKGAFKLDYKLKPDFAANTDPDEVLAGSQAKSYGINALDASSDAKTKAYFAPPADSPYYQSLSEKITNKTTGSEQIGAGYISKEVLNQTTNTAGNPINNMTMLLGNTGTLELETAIIKSGPEKVKTGNKITYTVKVYNYTDTKKTVTVKHDSGPQGDPFDVDSDDVVELTYDVPTTTAGTVTSTSTVTEIGGSARSVISNTVTTTVANTITYTINAQIIGGKGTVKVAKDTSTYDENTATTAASATPPVKATLTVEEKTEVTLTATAAAGYEFVGWFEDSAGTKAVTSLVPFEATKNITYYAKFALKIEAVVDGGKGGTVKITETDRGSSGEKEDSATLYVGGDKTVTLIADPAVGYEFDGWYDDSGTKVSSDKSYIISSPEAGAKYHAQFKFKKYTVTLNTNGGSVTPGTMERNHGDKISTLPTPTKPGQTFGGWYTDPDLKNPVNTNTPVTENITLYAKWTPAPVIPATYIVTLHHNGGSGEQTLVREYNGKIDSSPSSAREGYTFGGWYSDSGLKNAVDFPYTVNGNADWYAKWNPVTYTVTLHHNGGSGDQTIVKEKSGKIEAAPPSAREGYTFDGWYSDSGLQNKVDFSYTVTGNTDWFAKWVKNKNEGYIRTEISNPGTGTGDDDVIDKGDKYTLTVYDGDKPIKEIVYTITDGDDKAGKFTLIAEDLPDGDYTVVLKGPKPAPGQEITERVVIKNGKPDKDPLKMTLGGYIKNTKLQLKTTETPRVTVSGLNEIYDTNALTQGEKTLIITDGSSTTITLFAERVNDGNATFAGPLGRIKTLTVGQETALYLDLTLNKNINPADLSKGVNEAMHDSVELLTISIPLPTVDGVKVTSYRVYREHDGVATEIGQKPNAYGEYCEPITADGRAILHVRLFSLYAFTYSTAATGGNGETGTPGTTGPGTSEPGSPGSGNTGSGNTGTAGSGSTPGTSGSGNPGTSEQGTAGSAGTGEGSSGAASAGGSAAGGRNPKTGDNGSGMMLALLVISLGALFMLRRGENAR